MKIALVSPRSTFMSRLPEFRQFFEQAATISTYRKNWSGLSSALLVLGALTPPGHEVRVIDENLEEIDLDAAWDLVGITLMTHQATRAYEIADAFRAAAAPVSFTYRRYRDWYLFKVFSMSPVARIRASMSSHMNLALAPPMTVTPIRWKSWRNCQTSALPETSIIRSTRSMASSLR